MPFDSLPQETKADPFTLEALIEWLELQPAQADYCYVRSGHCLLAQYFSQLAEHVSVNPWSVTLGTAYRKLPVGFDEIAVGRPHTFGAALKRARRLLSERCA